MDKSFSLPLVANSGKGEAAISSKILSRKETVMRVDLVIQSDLIDSLLH